jgi:putative transposase
MSTGLHPGRQLESLNPRFVNPSPIQTEGFMLWQEAGLSTAEVCRKHGISTATFFGWKAMFGGREVSEAKWLKQLEDENAKLKRLLADALLNNPALKDLMTKKFGRPPPSGRLSPVSYPPTR